MPITTPAAVEAGPPVPSSADPEATFDAQYEAFNTWERDTLRPGLNALAQATFHNATEATTKAEEAGTSAGSAATAAATATTKASEAYSSAASASSSASTAATQSGIATTKASEASASAAAAAASAAAAAASAASISDGPVTSVNGMTGVVTISTSTVTLSGTTSIYVTQVVVYTITNHNVFSDYVVQVNAGSVSMTGDQITFTAPATAQTVTLTVTVNGNPTTFPLVVQSAGVLTPTNSSPTNGATNQSGTVTLTSSAFAWAGVADTHASSDWQLATDAAFTSVVQSQTASATNKTSWTVSGLSTNQTYYWRVRHTGAANGTSGWSSGTSFTTAASFSGVIGTAGAQGFGVGAYTGTLPSGFSALSGSSDPTSANYGNYQYSDGSIMVFVPRFYYRIGSASSPRFATYGAHAIDVVGIDTYATEAAANAAGFAMHRAFKDGGSDKAGFFVDKYLASKNGNSCRSVQNGNPISLTTNTNYNPSNGMTGCTGILADAVVLARSRAAGVFNVASIFIYDALAKLSLAHAQASTSTTHCAWYDAAGTTNFPKGCNNGSLADVNDTTVTFTNATPGVDTKPLTGSASNLAKTTHNGQASGVADVNGAMWQVMLGITQAGTSATDSAQNTTGTAYVLKSSVALSTLTGGWSGTNDAWGTTSSLATNYDAITGFLPWTSTTGWEYFGNGSNAVFSSATSGTDWLRSCSGIGATTGMSAAGTNQFGNDGNYRYGVANLSPMASGDWNSAADAGVFFRYWSVVRSTSLYGVGFRAAAYGN